MSISFSRPLDPRDTVSHRRRKGIGRTRRRSRVRTAGARRAVAVVPSVVVTHQEAPGRVGVVGLHRVHLDGPLHLDLEPGAGRVRHGRVVVNAVGVVDKDRPLFPAVCRPHVHKHRAAAAAAARLRPVLARPLAVVGLARDVAPDKGPQGRHRARDDGEVDFDAGPDGNVHPGDWSCLTVIRLSCLC